VIKFQNFYLSVQSKIIIPKLILRCAKMLKGWTDNLINKKSDRSFKRRVTLVPRNNYDSIITEYLGIVLPRKSKPESKWNQFSFVSPERRIRNIQLNLELLLYYGYFTK